MLRITVTDEQPGGKDSILLTVVNVLSSGKDDYEAVVFAPEAKVSELDNQTVQKSIIGRFDIKNGKKREWNDIIREIFDKII